MIKFTLIIWVCSFLGQNMCMAPIESTILYDSWYECSRTAHSETLLLMSKMGYKYVNDNRIAMSYSCRQLSSI